MDGRVGARPRVLHITECYAGGVETMLRHYAALVPEADHLLLANSRRGAAVGDAAGTGLFAEVLPLPEDHRGAIAEVTRQVRRRRPDVIHAHSSFAGAYARLGAGWLPGMRRRIAYTPHGLAVEDASRSRLSRVGYAAVETALSPLTGVFAGCSTREDELLGRLNPWIRRRPVRNAVPAANTAEVDWSPNAPATIGIAARIAPQRRPEMFAAVAGELRRRRPELRMIWIGDGDPAGRAVLVAAGVEVTGWLPRAEVLRRVAGLSVYLHCASQDGFPLAVLEAVGIGVPVVVPDIPSLHECPDGARYRDTGGATAAVLAALEDPAAAAAAWAPLLARYGEPALRDSLRALYLPAGGSA
ncbi:glycosyltransferase [Corynebacterium sphenisci]|uniref:glycosyltransferase n=1 Tax=Corynebacterium sphenisci TaxID=191493 RepID=UPI0009513B33|nr:glycosyltransferase [Corynebacterium sphenisci]